MTRFKPVNPEVNFPELEGKIIKYWKDNKIFEKSLENRKSSPKWNFLDGPPFITGLPHYGSLLSSIPKDVFPRYKTMTGHYVRRVWGWDCHGLPAENKVEEKLGIVRKRDIEDKIGVKKFIDECKLYVNQVSGEWEWYIDHVGRWVDFKNAYKTMDLPYMETVMWVFKGMFDKGYIYKGLRVSLYCPHCSTPISNFEVAMDVDNYKEITEPSNTYKYQLEQEKDTYLLAWSTTPWNKIVTPALAVNPKLKYVKVQQGNEKYILAKSTIKMLNGKHKILEEFKGADLIGKIFIPHYDFYKIDKGKKAFVVIAGDFVTADEGTGIVTIAAYGEDDLRAMQSQNIQIVMHLDEEGNLTGNVPNWGGMYYLKVNKLVNEDLVKRGLMYKEEQYTHTVPTCWRCHTRLYYAPQNAWFVDIQKLKPKLKKTNENINWYPRHFKYGRYLKSLENAPDWCISRSRYWGSPVPVWECSKCGYLTVPGSIKELEELSGQKITDFHKPEIDEVKIKCPKCSSKAHRVPEVLDSWIEAGSAPFAERHFPFEKSTKLEDFFPPDFITEYTGQIRAWFYVLHVIAIALYEQNAFKNVLVSGVILGTDGRKMSKNYNNYPDPKELLQKYGGDALRLYLLGSPVMRGEDILISEDTYRQQVRGLLLLLWNIYNFFVTYANVDGWVPKESDKPSNPLDLWILSRLNSNIKNTETGYEKFNTIEIVTNFDKMIRDLSLWYIRRTRERVGPTVKDTKDKEDAYSTMYKVLVEYSRVLAPLIPFVTEEIYTNLTGEESIHLSDWPKVDTSLENEKLEKDMEAAIDLSSAIHAFRKEAGIKVRTPLKTVSYTGPVLSKDLEDIVLSEVNIQNLKHSGQSAKYKIKADTSVKNQDQKAGQAREIIRLIQQARKVANCELTEYVEVQLSNWPKEYEEEIKNQTLAKNLTKGKDLKIIRSSQNG